LEGYTEIEFINIEENNEYISLIENVINKCFEEEKLKNANMYLNIILTDPEYIRKINKEYRNIDRETDVLSFPMFEKEEIEDIIKESSKNKIEINEVLGDIIVSIPKVKQQAIEYGHSEQRELAYMIVHGFYHIMGHDHMSEEEKQIMREKEENILNKLDIKRD